MVPPSKPSASASSGSFRALLDGAHKEVVDRGGGVREIRVTLGGPPLRIQSRMVSSDLLTFIHGENLADQDLVVRHEEGAPLVALHAPLRGSASAFVDGLGSAITNRTGHLQLFASPTADATVRLPARVRNEAFRIHIARRMILALATRCPQLDLLAARVSESAPCCFGPVTPAPLHRLLDDVREIMDSEHYGMVRPLFLEARALAWLAAALATPREGPADSAARLPRREVERMHQARDLLLTRQAEPPTLAEVAASVGTNDFALKRNFKAVFGQPVYAHLLSLRLAHACQLLRDTSATIKEIATSAGYAHPNHFSTAFRRAYGTSPTLYRAAAHGQGGGRPRRR
jgi:AraC-like DNA-binding protein